MLIYRLRVTLEFNFHQILEAELIKLWFELKMH